MKIILCTSYRQDPDYQVSARVQHMLIDAGAEIIACPLVDGPEAPRPGDFTWSTVEAEKSSADAMIVFGGDGTLLRAARMVADVGLPIAAVNLGHLGFITELGPGDIQELKRLVDGDYNLTSRMMLDIRLMRENRCLLEGFALNDIEIKGLNRVISLEISGDGATILNYTGDGAVIATPTGSTAYSMSAGGPIVEPDANSIIVTPICAHMLAARSFVLSPNRHVCVRVTEERINPSCLSIDGDNPIDLMTNDTIEIRRSEKVTNLIRFSTRSFYSTVFEKLGDR